MSEAPDWVVPGQPVSVESTVVLYGGRIRSSVRTWTVSRVGARYIVLTDAMGNEQKFQTSTLSRSPSAGRTEVLVPPDRTIKE